MADEVFEKFDLPSGGWVAFRDPKRITRSQRKPLDRAKTRLGLAVNIQKVLQGVASASALPDDDLDLFEGLMNACAAVLIDSWSFPEEPSPAAVAAVDSEEDYQAIIDRAQKHRSVLLPDFTPGPETDENGDLRPTGSSDGSVTTSEGNPPTLTSLSTS